MARIVTVFGATGPQGSGVVKALLEDGTFVPRAITRNPSSAAAQKLKERGADIVQADFSDRESLEKALEGSEGVFGVTNFFNPAVGDDPKDEIKQGKLLVDVAKEAGVQFFLWSSLPSITALSNGKYRNVLHFDNKTVIDDYLRQSGLPHAILKTGGFLENLWNWQTLKKISPETLELTIARCGDVEMPFLWVERDLGATALALFKNYKERKDEILNQTFIVVTARSTYPKLAEIISKIIGKQVKYSSPPTTGLVQFDEVYDYQHEVGIYKSLPIPDPRLIALGVEFGTLEEFADQEVKPRFT